MDESTRVRMCLSVCVVGYLGESVVQWFFPLELLRVYKETASSRSGTGCACMKWKAVMLLPGASQGQHLNAQERSVLRPQGFSLLRTPGPEGEGQSSL